MFVNALFLTLAIKLYTIIYIIYCCKGEIRQNHLRQRNIIMGRKIMDIKDKISPAILDEMLKLDNQLCFSLYVCSKEIVRKYRPFLEPLGLTYTGYISMLALWEEDNVTVKDLGKRLYLDSGTLTPLLKKLQKQGYITRTRSLDNEKNVYIQLTKSGRDLKNEAIHVPIGLADSVGCGIENGEQLLLQLHKLMIQLSS
jgi:MarR family transcriptional regulator, organic hydroperoxide resistance regulator